MTKYSNTLGVIEVAQFQKALDTFHLSKFIEAEKVPNAIVIPNSTTQTVLYL